MNISLLLLAACVSLDVHEVPADEVLVSIRAAVVSEARSASPGSVLVSGVSHEHGMDGTFEFLFDARGNFRHAVTSRIGEVVAFDGETSWAQDPSGITRRMSFTGKASCQGWLWVQSGHWLDVPGPFEITRLEGLVKDSEAITLRLTHRDAPWEATLFVDPASYLPTKLVRQRSAGERVYNFADWQPALGLRYPRQVTVNNVSGDISTFEATQVSKAPSYFRNPFEPIFHRPGDAHFDASKPSAVEARRVSTGHLLVHPRVNGKDVGWFILDSGAGAMCIDPDVADKLELETFGEVSVVGAGGATKGRFRAGAALELGPVTIPKLPWLELDTSFLEPVFGVPIAGIIGYEFFARTVVSIDLSAGEVNLHDPERFELDGRWQSLLFDDRIPCVEASFEGDHREWFRLDTGSNDTVTFHSPIVERLRLLEGRETYGAAHTGVGGTKQARRGGIDWFELGGERMEQLDVSFSQATGSVLTTEFTAGNLGSGILARFTLVLDYGGERIAFLAPPE